MPSSSPARGRSRSRSHEPAADGSPNAVRERSPPRALSLQDQTLALGRQVERETFLVTTQGATAREMVEAGHEVILGVCHAVAATLVA